MSLFAKQRLAVEVDLLRGDFDGGAHALENAVGRRQRLADGANPAAIGNDNVGEGAAGIHRNTKRHIAKRPVRLCRSQLCFLLRDQTKPQGREAAGHATDV
jgi:hypothetical protein